MSIGSNIRRLRRLHRESQEALARVLGVTSVAVSQWENERVQPRMGIIEKLSIHWGIPKSEIIDPPEGEEVRGVTDQEWDLLNLFRQLNARGKLQLIELAAAMVGSGNYQPHQGGGDTVQSSGA